MPLEENGGEKMNGNMANVIMLNPLILLMEGATVHAESWRTVGEGMNERRNIKKPEKMIMPHQLWKCWEYHKRILCGMKYSANHSIITMESVYV